MGSFGTLENVLVYVTHYTAKNKTLFLYLVFAWCSFESNLFIPKQAVVKFIFLRLKWPNVFPRQHIFSGEASRQNLAGGHIYGEGFDRKSFLSSCRASPKDLLTNIKVNGVALFSGRNSISALLGCK